METAGELKDGQVENDGLNRDVWRRYGLPLMVQFPLRHPGS